MPKIETNGNEKLLTVISLAKAGYGSPEEILKMRTDIVLGMIAYEKFKNEYESSYIALNKKD